LFTAFLLLLQGKKETLDLSLPERFGRRSIDAQTIFFHDDFDDYFELRGVRANEPADRPTGEFERQPGEFEC
jgi:hypothetical protein